MNHITDLTQIFPLNTAKPHQSLYIKEIIGGKQLIKRMIALGLIKDTLIEIIQAQTGQGLIIQLYNQRIALGMGVASKIMVSYSKTDTLSTGEND